MYGAFGVDACNPDTMGLWCSSGVFPLRFKELDLHDALKLVQLHVLASFVTPPSAVPQGSQSLGGVASLPVRWCRVGMLRHDPGFKGEGEGKGEAGSGSRTLMDVCSRMPAQRCRAKARHVVRFVQAIPNHERSGMQVRVKGDGGGNEQREYGA